MFDRLSASGLCSRPMDDGATAVEYGLMVALVTLVVVFAVGMFGQAVMGLFQRAVTNWPT